MSMKADRFMPLWTGDYQRATTHLSAEESGAYLHLLMAYWDRRGPLDDDDRQLALIARSTPKAWRKLRPVIAKFFSIADGRWTHGRVEKELAEAAEMMERASKRGEIAARKRWSKQPEILPDENKERQNSAVSECETQCAGIAQALPEQCSSPSPSPSKTLAIASAGPEPGNAPPFFADDPWDRGVAVLAKAGITQRRARECLGRWITLHGRNAVVAALDRAAAETPAEPIAFLERVLSHGQTETRHNRKPARLGLDDALAAVLAERRAAEPAESQIGA